MNMTSERLHFRPMTHDDIPLLLEIFSDPIAMQFYPNTKSAKETAAWVNWNAILYPNLGLHLLFKKETKEFIGQCGLVPQEVASQPELEIGYLLVRKHWGYGYATEAALFWRYYAQEILNQKRLISLIDPNNLPSQAVARRIGMHYEKTVSWHQKEHEVYAFP